MTWNGYSGHQRSGQMEIIKTVPTEKLEQIEIEAEYTGNWEASELVGEELYRRALAHLAIRGEQ